jgi:hypothetical protein
MGFVQGNCSMGRNGDWLLLCRAWLLCCHRWTSPIAIEMQQLQVWAGDGGHAIAGKNRTIATKQGNKK